MTDFPWSEETYTIQQLALRDEFPVVVRVTEGYLPENGNEADSFSQGDLIKLDFKKIYEKVAARFLDAKSKVDSAGYLHSGGDLMIPRGYKGKVKIIHGKTDFSCVKELLEEFPRFVKVNQREIKCTSLKRSILLRDAVIELIRENPQEGLICRYENMEIVLKSDQIGQFSLVQDETHYTLMDLIQRFPLPQNVQFIDTQFHTIITEDLDEAIENIKKFEGCLKLLRVVHQEVLVGHYKPLVDTTESKSEQFCRRAIALLPLDNKVVREIEVQVPVYSQSDDYEFLVAKNFSETIDMEEIEGGLYLEFSNIPRIHKIEQKFADAITTDAPPPRPPKPGQISGGQQKGRQKRRDPPPLPTGTLTLPSSKATDDRPNDVYDIPTDDYEDVDDDVVSPGKGLKGRQKQNKIPSASPVTTAKEDNPNDVYDLPTDDYEDVDDDFLPAGKGHIGRQKQTATINPAGYGCKDEEEDVYEIHTNVTATDVSPKSKDWANKIGTDLGKRMKSGFKMVQKRVSKWVNRAPISKTDDNASKNELDISGEAESDDELEYDYPDLRKMPQDNESPLLQTSKQSYPIFTQKQQNKGRPVAQVSPLFPGRETDKKEANKPFNEMSVEEVVQCFQECTLDSLANKCKVEKLDGKFLSEIPHSDINELLQLSSLQGKKFLMIKEGWRPKRDG